MQKAFRAGAMPRCRRNCAGHGRKWELWRGAQLTVLWSTRLGSSDERDADM